MKITSALRKGGRKERKWEKAQKGWEERNGRES